MTTATESADPATSGTEPSTTDETGRAVGRRRWQPWALGAIVALSLVLYGWNLGAEGWGNSFYSAAVKSMSENLTNFLFGSFDPAGVVTVDKPPMAFWPQVFSAWVFGYHGWALLLPQVLEGGAAVFLLHRTVRRWAGENVALVAALVLAITPITVAINRDNNPDTLLTLLGVASAYAVTRSIEPGIPARSATKWLLQAAFWVGCGFLTKMLAGWMIVPALALAYLFGRNAGWGRRLGDLAGAAVVMLASSLWWVALTVLWPSPKPYVGGSTNGSALDLIIGYNGLGRVFGQSMGRGGGRGGPGPQPPQPGNLPAPPGGGGFGGGRGGGGAGAFGGGDAGFGRLFGESVGGQISWLLPLCLLVLVVVTVAGLRSWRKGKPAGHFRRGGWVLWGSWLVVLGLVFSFQQGIFHSYYTTELAPAIAALAAAGTALLWRHYRTPGGAAWLLLPGGIALTAVWAWLVISRDPSWQGWLRYAVAVLAIVAVAGLVVSRIGAPEPRTGTRIALVLGIVAMALAPAVWSGAKAVTTTGGMAGGVMPSAGPSGAAFGGMRRMGDIPGMPNTQQIENIMRTGEIPGGRRIGGADLSPEQRRILDYATKNANGAQIVLAVEGGSMGSSSYIINSDQTVIGMGGFMGSDNAPSVQLLTEWKAQGKLGFVLGESAQRGGRQASPGGFGGMMGRSGAAQERTAWVEKNCTVVPPDVYGGTDPNSQASAGAAQFGMGAQTLYQCR
jgi:4-amino-4-deoxy-L-arabinose transferase-like glycosyltransferase